MHIFSPTTKAESAKVNENFADLASGAGDDTGNSLYVWRAEAMPDFVVSGLVWSQVSGLNGSMTDGVAIISGIRATALAIASKTFTASKDTYIDIGTDGTIYYTEVANNATTGMTLASGRKRLCVVITNGSAITKIYSLGYDPLGNRFYNTVAYLPRLRPITSGEQFANGSDTTANHIMVKRPRDAITINGRTIRLQYHLRANANGVYSMYRASYNLKHGAVYVQLETSGTTVGDTASYQNLTMSLNQMDMQYWCNYDLSAFDYRDILRVDLHRDGAGASDTATGIVEQDYAEVYYNKDYTKAF